MRNYRIYICGPIAGYEDLNKKAFEEAAEFILEMGHYPLNPHTIDPFDHFGNDCPGGNKFYGHKEVGLHSSTCYMRNDIKAMMDCDGIYVLHGWEASVGGRTEILIAAQCGMDVYFQDQKLIPHGTSSVST